MLKTFADNQSSIAKWMKFVFNLLMTQEAFVNTVDQDQPAQNQQFDLWSTLSTFIQDYK